MTKYLILLCVIIFIPACQDKQKKLDGKRISMLSDLADIKISRELMKTKLPMPPTTNNISWPGDTTLQNLYVNSSGVYKSDAPRKFNIDANNNFSLNTSHTIFGQNLYSMGSDGTIYNFDLTSKKILWESSVLKEMQNSGYAIGSGRSGFLVGGILYNDGVLFATGGVNIASAIDAKSGKLIWEKKLSSPLRSYPLKIKEHLVTQSIDGKIIVFEAKTGQIKWSHVQDEKEFVELSNQFDMLSYGNYIIFSRSGNLSAIDVTSGKMAWNQFDESTITSYDDFSDDRTTSGSIVSSGDIAFETTSSGAVHATNLKNGNTIWKRDLGVIQKPWIYGDYLLAITHDNHLLAIHAKDAKIRWRTSLRVAPKGNDIHFNSPICINSMVAVADSDGVMSFYSPQNGSLIRHIPIQQDVFQSPFISSGKIYTVSKAGYIEIIESIGAQ